MFLSVRGAHRRAIVSVGDDDGHICASLSGLAAESDTVSGGHAIAACDDGHVVERGGLESGAGGGDDGDALFGDEVGSLEGKGGVSGVYAAFSLARPSSPFLLIVISTVQAYTSATASDTVIELDLCSPRPCYRTRQARFQPLRGVRRAAGRKGYRDLLIREGRSLGWAHTCPA